jgi:serine/threonine-protein kinase
VLRQGVALPGSSSYTAATLGWALARNGHDAEARDILRTLQDEAEHAYVSPVAFATLYIGLGETESALDFAERAHAERRGWPAYFRVNPVVDPLRGEPRFERIADAMGLPRPRERGA